MIYQQTKFSLRVLLDWKWYNSLLIETSGLLLMDLSISLAWICIPFVLATIYFGTRNGYYNSDNYQGDGCAHDVQRWVLRNITF